MRYFCFSLFFSTIFIGLQAQSDHGQNHSRWTKDQANEWYANQPWPCGFNYVPANTISYTEMWMPYCFDTTLIANELVLAQDIGFNCLRVVLPFVACEQRYYNFS